MREKIRKENLEATYQELVNAFGEPKIYREELPRYVEFIVFHDSGRKIGTIHNWERSHMKAEDITFWKISGISDLAVNLIENIIKKNK